MATLVIHDESASGQSLASLELIDLPERITVRELIRHRVREEVARHNAGPSMPWRGLVTPEEAAARGLTRGVSRSTRVDWEQQAASAEKAFDRNGFFVLVGDRQVESLDEVIELSRDEHVAFVKLVPLVGG
jgi:hypothetical protein